MVITSSTSVGNLSSSLSGKLVGFPEVVFDGLSLSSSGKGLDSFGAEVVEDLSLSLLGDDVDIAPEIVAEGLFRSFSADDEEKGPDRVADGCSLSLLGRVADLATGEVVADWSLSLSGRAAGLSVEEGNNGLSLSGRITIALADVLPSLPDWVIVCLSLPGGKLLTGVGDTLSFIGTEDRYEDEGTSGTGSLSLSSEY